MQRLTDRITVLGLLLMLSCACSAQTSTDSVLEDRPLLFDSLDLIIIQRADHMLSDSSRWHKMDDRVCEDDIANGRYSLFCVLYAASKELTGEYVHRRAGMQQVRFILEKYEKGRVINHRLMDWNNHPDTTFEEVKRILRESIDTVALQLKQQMVNPKQHK